MIMHIVPRTINLMINTIRMNHENKYWHNGRLAGGDTEETLIDD